MKRYKRTLFFMIIISSCVLYLTQCSGDSLKKEDTKEEPEFAGSSTCAGCHKDIYDKHIHTAHYLTTRPAIADYIKGSFKEGHNSFAYNQAIKVLMEHRDSNFYQVAYLNGIEKKRERFDMVVGSGTKGQTYLYWKSDSLYQLPIFYFTQKDEWANSPGYGGKIIFNRPITSRCLECHSTYAKKLTADENMPEPFSRGQIVYGVDCEKCHGAASQHVSFHLANPKDSIGRYIINPAVFSRQQKLDMCALCHGGRLSKTKPSFSFQPGDTLSNYFTLNSANKQVADIDVHGNQYGLLVASKCFLKSELTCNNCHNVHVNETGNKADFSKRCMSCHNTGNNHFCKMAASVGPSITENCIDCHMPLQTSRAIIFQEQGKEQPTAATMRTHYIAIYPEESRKIFSLIKHLHDQKK